MIEFLVFKLSLKANKNLLYTHSPHPHPRRLRCSNWSRLQSCSHSSPWGSCVEYDRFSEITDLLTPLFYTWEKECPWNPNLPFLKGITKLFLDLLWVHFFFVRHDGINCSCGISCTHRSCNAYLFVLYLNSSALSLLSLASGFIF